MANLNDKLISYGNLAEFHIKLLNDLVTSDKSTWSSQKIQAMNAYVTSELAGKADAADLNSYATIAYVTGELAAKQDALTAGQNITIDANSYISVDGYVFDETDGSFATKYLNTNDEPYIATNSASGEGAFAEGYNTTASGGYGTHAEGYETTASGDYGAHAEGIQTTATGQGSHAEGAYGTVASGNYSHAEGGATTASESGAHAEGQQTTASGKWSHAEGGKAKGYNGTTASANAAHAEGESTSAEGQASHTEGSCTQAKNPGEHAQGLINLSHKVSDNMWDGGNTLHSIGIGYSQNYVPYRKNALEVMQNGDYYLIGVGNYQGTDTKVQDATIQTLQDVVNGKADVADLNSYATIAYVTSELAGKADVYEIATTADIEALFTPQVPVQADNEIWYTTSNNELWEPYNEALDGDMLEIYPNNPSLRNHLLSNIYENGHGVLKYANNVTTLPEAWGSTDSMHPSQLTTLTLPHSISFVGSVLDGNPNLNTIYYNGTVAECGEINFDYFGEYADFDINQIICLDGIYDL